MQCIECNGTAAITRSRHQKSFSCYVDKHLLYQRIGRQSFYVLMTSAVNGISQLCVLKTEFCCTNISVLCVIAGFHRGANEVFAVLVYYTAFIDSYRRFGPTFKENGSSWLLKMELVGFSHALVYNFKLELRNISEERKSHICIWILHVTYCAH
jgi:hypothetical protein